jgi:RNA polymerase sigma-70 factor (ECF subfamily)
MSVASARADGDAEAFETLFAANHDDLLRYAARRLGPDAAPDVVADVMLIAWRRRGEYSSEDARLWLFGVAHHVVANERRSALRRERLAERARQEAATRPSAVDPAESDTDRVRALLSIMPPAEQEALRLTEWDQPSTDEAARVAGCSRATFRVRLHRARRRFARLLAEQDARPHVLPDATASTKGARS